MLRIAAAILFLVVFYAAAFLTAIAFGAVMFPARLWVVLGFAGIVTALGLFGLFWQLGGRFLAVRLGLVPKNVHDYLVDAWNAQRDTRYLDALAAYDEALALDPGNPDTLARMKALQDHMAEIGVDR